MRKNGKTATDCATLLCGVAKTFFFHEEPAIARCGGKGIVRDSLPRAFGGRARALAAFIRPGVRVQPRRAAGAGAGHGVGATRLIATRTLSVVRAANAALCDYVDV